MTDPNTPDPSTDPSHLTVADELDPPGCQSWAPGHRVHWVQGMRSNRSTEPGSYVACTVTDATDDGWFTLVVTATREEFRYWNHDPERVRGLVGRGGLEVNQRWSVLHERLWSGCSTSYTSIRETATPCVFDDPTGPLHEQLQTHGGFSISGPDALRMIADSEQEDGSDDRSG